MEGYLAETIIDFFQSISSDFRVSELIEEVKSAFSINILQKPQGNPLFLRGHKGGEFVFKVKQISDKRNLKGYTEFINILQLYKRNSLFTEVLTYEDKTKKIGFQLYMEVDSVLKKAVYYLYLYEGIIQTQTYRYLFANQPKIFNDKNLIIFLIKEKHIQNLETRNKRTFSKNSNR